ncbi:MAG: hypothetical protein ACXABY_11270 [Candidatus Thorarchaeota archaeon]|jgi:hypothetical protein
MSDVLKDAIVLVLKKGPMTKAEIRLFLAIKGIGVRPRGLLAKLTKLRREGVLSNENPGSSIWELPKEATDE